MKKAPKFSHTSPSKRGSGVGYGSGVKNPTGKPVDVFQANVAKPKKLGRAPKSLA